MNCLFTISNDPVSRNYSGGASIYLDQLLALKNIGHKVIVLHFASTRGRKTFNQFYADHPEDWAIFRSNCDELYLVDYTVQSGFFFKVLNKLFNLTNRYVSKFSLSCMPVYHKIKELIKLQRVDFIWAQHLESVIIALNFNPVPLVYIHHDWQYKTKAMKNDKIEDVAHKLIEERACRLSDAVVSGSFSEYTQIFALGVVNSFYIPVSYEVPVPSTFNEIPDIVHLGGMNTTANVIGIENFIDIVWNDLDLPKDRFVVIGGLNGARDNLQNKIKTYKWLGFVKDLSSVLKNGDIHIIPWHKDTGTRTRVPMAFSFGQVVVAVEESVKCFPELKNGWNCILVPSLKEMSGEIIRIINDPSARKQISENAIATFSHHFMQKGLEIRYASVIESLGIRKEI